MKAAAAFLLFLALGLLLAWPALHWPMVFDDLHLVRTFRPGELAAAWSGHWDPDGLETPGYRPLSLAFNHTRAALFGEDVAAHRVLLVALYALNLALLVPLGRRLGLTFSGALAAGLVMLTTRYSAYHVVWITDGNHLVQGLAFLSAALLLIDGLAEGSRTRLAASLAAIGAGVLVREDTLAALPALALLAFTCAKGRRRAAAVYVAGLGTLAAALLLWRRAVVPKAQPLGLDFDGFARAVVHAFNPVGVDGFDVPTIVLANGWWAVLALTAAGLAVSRDRSGQRWAIRWAVAAVAAATPGLLLQRDDLLFFPSLFVALALGAAWAAIWEARPRLRPAVAMAAAWAMVGGAWTGARLAENFHPASARAIDWNTEFLYGRYATATIPPARRAAVAAQLDALGIRKGEEPRQRVRALVAEAKEAGRRRPTPDGRVFFPLLPERYF
jgi:hypothetical protein